MEERKGKERQVQGKEEKKCKMIYLRELSNEGVRVRVRVEVSGRGDSKSTKEKSQGRKEERKERR